MSKRLRSDKSDQIGSKIHKRDEADVMEEINSFPEKAMSDCSDREVNLFAESPQPEIITVDVHRDIEGVSVAHIQENFDFLGEKPKQTKEMKEPLHEQLVIRWSSYIQNGIDKDNKEAIIAKYPLLENCPLLKVAELGPELSSCLNSKALRQDKFMAQLQKETGHALSAIGSQINKLLATNVVEMKETTTVLADVAQLICNVQHAISTHRKYNILSFLNSSCRKLVEDSKTDEFLLGKNFIEELKANETARKTGLELKTNTSYHKPATFKPYSKFSGNNLQPQVNPNYPRSTGKNFNFKRQPSNTRKKILNNQSSQRYRNEYNRNAQYYNRNRN